MARAAQSGPSTHSLSTLQVGSFQEDSEAPTPCAGLRATSLGFHTALG